jgi:hypothetical protein
MRLVNSRKHERIPVLAMKLGSELVATTITVFIPGRRLKVVE